MKISEHKTWNIKKYFFKLFVKLFCFLLIVIFPRLFQDLSSRRVLHKINIYPWFFANRFASAMKPWDIFRVFFYAFLLFINIITKLFSTLFCYISWFVLSFHETWVNPLKEFLALISLLISLQNPNVFWTKIPQGRLLLNKFFLKKNLYYVVKSLLFFV